MEEKITIEYYDKLYEKFETGELSECEYLKKIDGDNVTEHFYRARFFLLKKEDVKKARKHIDRAIVLFETETTTTTITKGDPLANIKSLIRIPEFTLFSCAGQIYAELDNYERSLEYHKKSNYFLCQLKSEYENDFAYLYSFRPVSEYSLDDLKYESITVCHPSKMNDPFDSLFLLWSTNNNLNKICERSRKHIKPLVQSFQYFKIRCFVGNKNLTSDDGIVQKLLMWSHYANGHKGFCIKYKLSPNFIKKDRNKDYTHHYLKKVELYSNEENKTVVTTSMNTTELFALKSKVWEYEDEIRLISYDPSCGENDYQQISLDEESSVEAIYFGYRCAESNIKDIMKISGNKIEYYIIDCDFENIYKLKILRIKYEDYVKEIGGCEGDV